MHTLKRNAFNISLTFSRFSTLHLLRQNYHFYSNSPHPHSDFAVIEKSCDPNFPFNAPPLPLFIPAHLLSPPLHPTHTIPSHSNPTYSFIPINSQNHVHRLPTLLYPLHLFNWHQHQQQLVHSVIPSSPITTASPFHPHETTQRCFTIIVFQASNTIMCCRSIPSSALSLLSSRRADQHASHHPLTFSSRA